MASPLDGATFAFAAGVETAAAPPLDLSLDEIIKLRKKTDKPAAKAKAGAAVRLRAAPTRARRRGVAGRGNTGCWPGQHTAALPAELAPAELAVVAPGNAAWPH
jgi:hypothetical protein